MDLNPIANAKRQVIVQFLIWGGFIVLVLL